jgi:hypothetical protein
LDSLSGDTRLEQTPKGDEECSMEMAKGYGQAKGLYWRTDVWPKHSE